MSLRARLWRALKRGNPGNKPSGRDNFLPPLMPLPGKRFSVEEPALDSEEAVAVSMVCVACVNVYGVGGVCVNVYGVCVNVCGLCEHMWCVWYV